MTMSLADWQKNGWIKAHQATPREVADLLALAARDLKESKAKGLGDDWRFSIAYNAALQASTAALIAAGYSAAKGESNHFRVIQSLSLTIGLDTAKVDQFDRYRKKRSMTIYDVAGAVTAVEAKQIHAFATELFEQVRSWIASAHADLLPKSGG
jgi:hypothetical protein